jgi:hypothetical protein
VQPAEPLPQAVPGQYLALGRGGQRARGRGNDPRSGRGSARGTDAASPNLEERSEAGAADPLGHEEDDSPAVTAHVLSHCPAAQLGPAATLPRHGPEDTAPDRSRAVACCSRFMPCRRGPCRPTLRTLSRNS